MEKKRIKNNLPKKDLSEFKDLLIFFNPNFNAKSYISIDNSNTRLSRVIKRNPKVADLIKAFDMVEVN